MVRVSTFCPRCGETIEAEVSDEAKATGRASMECPACRFSFIIAPTRRPDAAPLRAGAWERSDAPTAVPVPPPSATHATSAAGGRPRTSFRPVAAAMLLFFSALLGVWMGSVLAFEDDLMTSGFANMQGEGNFTGRVRGPDGPLAGVAVAILVEDENGTETADQEAITDGRGRYAFPGIDPGVYRFRFSKENYTTVLLDAPAYPQEYSRLLGDESVLGSVTMRPGDPAETRTESRLDEFATFARVWGWFTLVCAAVAVAGGIAALRRRPLWLAVTGSVAGIFTFGFVVGMVTAVLALALILWARREFSAAPSPMTA